MAPDNGDRTDRATRTAIVWVIVLVMRFTLIVIAALIWRSGWWTEAGSSLPRGTERRLLVPDSV
jgi:hypothetical protein